jgi:small GTP-binding protein
MTLTSKIQPDATCRIAAAHRNSILSLAWSPTESVLASSGLDNTLHLWNGVTGEPVKTLEAAGGYADQLAWSADGSTLMAFVSAREIVIWDAKSGGVRARIAELGKSLSALAPSPDGRYVAAAVDRHNVHLWDCDSGKLLTVFQGHEELVSIVRWSPLGNSIASASRDCTVRIWDPDKPNPLVLVGHGGPVTALAWNETGTELASGSTDRTIVIWNPETAGRHVREGHTSTIRSLFYAPHHDLLVSRSENHLVGLWQAGAPGPHAFIRPPFSVLTTTSIAVNESRLFLAATDYAETSIRLVSWDLVPLLHANENSKTGFYSNAKVVLVGETGVGKSGLSIVLTGQPWSETGSTHGRRVWTFESSEAERSDGQRETCETLLWDLAGQPDYRLIHQLHLTEVVLALVVVDARSQLDPFAGVRHWDKALRQAQRVQGNSAPPLKKFLVAARSDVGRLSVSRARIEALCGELAFDGYFETSAKEGWGIEELREAIRNAIPWGQLPKVSSPELFHSIKTFLIVEKEAGRLLSTVEDLFRTYLVSMGIAEHEELRVQFETCIGRVESRGLIQRLSFGNLVLLQPELRDAYASALANAAKDEPDGLGYISEDVARSGEFRIPSEERIRSPNQEKLLLISTIEELLLHEIALREHGSDGQYLVFPSHLTRENPDLPDPLGKTVIFVFEGPILNIYVTLAVRLSHSGFFTKDEFYKNAATYRSKIGGVTGMFLTELKEGRGELTLFFPDSSGKETRLLFEEYVHAHLRRRALPGTIQRRRIFACPECGTPVADVSAQRRRERGFDFIPCNVCDHQHISLRDTPGTHSGGRTERVSEMDRAADAQRRKATAASILEGKVATKDFDVFLCYNRTDRSIVAQTGSRLKEVGILPWLDIWEARPGLPWHRLLEEQLAQIRSAAVFVGPAGLGPWQELESQALLRQFIKRGAPVIPVVLPGVEHEPNLPIFLDGMTWADLRQPDGLRQLVWGITGTSELPEPM